MPSGLHPLADAGGGHTPLPQTHQPPTHILAGSVLHAQGGHRKATCVMLPVLAVEGGGIWEADSFSQHKGSGNQQCESKQVL